MGESIGIGLEASSTSKGPQAKTTEFCKNILLLLFKNLIPTRGLKEDVN